MASWRNHAPAVGLGVLFGFLASGAILLAARPPRGAPVRLLPPPEPPSLVVEVSGGVAQPGLLRLPPGSRVADALEEAGGVVPEGDPSLLNLAALVKDGEKVSVPIKQPTEAALNAYLTRGEAGQNPAVSPPAPNSPPAPAPDHPININSAPASELDLLPGIGPVIAQRILDYREAHGSFQSIEEIKEVKGIGEATFEKIKALITTGY
jgi:competence protein ComEA